MNRYRTIHNVSWPEGCRFAFTFVDDTDCATFENVKPVYDLLDELGLRTTKTVWPLSCGEATGEEGVSIDDDPGYRDFVLDLKRKGFEIALHGVRATGAVREEIERGLARYREIFGEYPRIHINHALNPDNICWGSERFRWLGWLYRLVTGERYFGGDPSSDYFWGDLHRQHIAYTRNLTFNDIDTLRADPWFPYRRPECARWGNLFFSASNAPDIEAAVDLLTRRNVDRLVRRGGLCIAYTHFGKGFAPGGALDERFAEAMRYVASQPGWFAPVGEVLDYLVELRGGAGELSGWQQLLLELRWARDTLKSRWPWRG